MSGIVVVDYGMGNLHSVRRKLRDAGAHSVLTQDPAVVATAEKLVLPGVGHFAEAMRTLESSGLREALDGAVRRRGAPILGICLGMQLFAAHSEEGDAAGLGWIAADVVRFRVSDPIRFKVPHIGWNDVQAAKESDLTRGLEARAEFYFVHAYHLACHDPSDVLLKTTYDYEFPSAVARENVYGVQFHPEKSHDAGLALLRRFAAI
jgi:glutamine amidotransferase